MIAGMTMALQAPRANPIQRAINTLFAASEPGAWYDPSDMSTLFQDSAGTTPVTAVEQPVGRMLDKSGRGNHAIQATTTKRPVLSARYALNLRSEYPNGLADAHALNGLVSSAAIPGFLGGTALAFGHDGVQGSLAYRSDFAPVIGVSYEVSAFFKMDDGGAPKTGSANASSANDFEFVFHGDSVCASPHTITAVGGGIYRVFATATATKTGQVAGLVKYSTNSPRTFKATGLNVCLATDAHLPYQRVTTDTDYDADPAKFPAYLRFDGVDDVMQTGNIDFTGTDKMTVLAGAVFSQSADQMLVNHNATGLRSLRIMSVSETSISSAAAGLSNTVQVLAPYPKHTIVAQYDLSSGTASVRVDGAGAGSSVTPVGGGWFASAQLCVGAQENVVRFFNGRLYSLIIRGAQSTLSQIEATEAYIKQKMRLP